MLKTILAVGPVVLAKVRDKNLKRVGKGIQVENRDEKELVQKSCKDQKKPKSKKWIRAIKAEAFKAKNFGI